LKKLRDFFTEREGP